MKDITAILRMDIGLRLGFVILGPLIQDRSMSFWTIVLEYLQGDVMYLSHTSKWSC